MNIAKILLVTTMLTGVVLADQLVIGNVTKDGSLQGFEKGKFRFLTSKGKFVKEQASRVDEIVLTKPVKVSYEASSGKKPETAMLKGYAKQKFTFVKEGKETVLPLKKIFKLDIQMESEGLGGKTSQNGNGGYPIPSVNLEAFSGDLTPEQQAILDKFKESKKIYDDFLRENAALVSEMDSSKGARRDELIDQLRKRKQEEQPLKKDLVSSYDALVNAFQE